MKFTALQDIMEFLLPRHCSICGRRLHKQEKGICTGCLLELNVSEFADGCPGNTLERTLWLRVPIERAAAFLVYDHDNSQRRIVLDLKYHNRPRLGSHMAPLMVQNLNATNFFETVDVIIPVPIPRRRRMKRGYNQSLELAKGISRLTGITVDTRSVTRRYYGVSQTKLSPSERAAHVEDSFVLHGNSLEGKHVLIVDDVITTTATVMACAKALSGIAGVRISIASLAVSRNLLNNIRSNNPQEDNSQAAQQEDRS